MAIWDNILKRALSPLVEQQLAAERERAKEEAVEKGLTAMSVSQNPIVLGAGKTGVKSVASPSGVSFQTLRQFSLYYPILRACINYRKRQITGLAWDVSPIEVNLDKQKVKGEAKKAVSASEDDKDARDVKLVKEFLRYPTGSKDITFRTFLNKVLEDVLTLDALAVYKRTNLKGGLFGYIPIDAATIELVLNEDGTVPTPPNPAYIQKVNGKVVAKLTTDEIVYGMMNARTHTPYGLSPVETLIITVSTALKLSSYNLAFLTEGNIPEGLVELPKDVASNQDQLRIWQEAWDAMFTGNLKYQRKIKFLPEGMKWTPIRKSEDMEFERFDKWLLLQTCSVMEVPPQAIGFQFDRGKGATEAEWEIGKERGLFPLANFIKEIMDRIIQDDLGMPHLEFTWQNINPTNKKEEADVFAQLVKTGAVSVDEWRLGEGLPPIGLGHFIMTPVGPIMVRDFVEASDEGHPLIPYNYQSGGDPNAALQGGSKAPKAESTGSSRAKKPNGYGADQGEPTAKPEKKPTSKLEALEIMEELKRWKKVASKAVKANEPIRDFKTDVIDARTQNILKEGLKFVTTKEDLDELFNPLISEENKVISEVIDLYDEVQSLTNHEQPTST